MEHNVIDLIVAVNKTTAIFGLRLLVAKEGHHVVVVRDLTNSFFGVDVDSLCLSVGDCLESRQLTVVEATALAVRCEIYRRR